MHTVLVVDDEAIVCQGIKQFLEQSDLPLAQVLTASNGYEALDYLRMENVDLVLTDIQMDGMNGIELMESILSEKPGVPVVVISAHDEFDYAQKCIRLGARDYLIKPVLLSQLITIVGRELTRRSEKYKLHLEDSLKLKFSMTGMSSLRTYILNEMISGSLEHADDYRYIFEQIGVTLNGPYFSVFVTELQWDRAGIGGESILLLRDRNLLKYATVNIMEETLKEWETISFYSQGHKIVTILQLDLEHYEQNKAESISKLNLMAKMMVQHIKQYLYMDAIVGISPMKLGLQALPDLYRQASEATRWHGLYETQTIFFAEDYQSREATLKVNWQQKTDHLMDKIKTGRHLEQLEHVVGSFVADISPVFEQEDTTAGILLSIAYRAYGVVLEMKETVGDRYKALDPIHYFQFPLQSNSMKQSLSAFLLECTELIYSSMIDHDRAIVQRTIAFIRAEFRNKELKIQDIADHVYLSPNYLSYLFKRISNETVWEYVTSMRMEEAKHLLLNTTKKRYEIADEVGYESPEHFSRVFKRYYGETPNAIRG
ncbi:DNA-binding response regulator [Paenibacillus agaridevorans]|uniref:DNA-binding response regulator n=1 Tax=Paenibacillus agaridevorans TaxID=171404 RepID=A0A2R5EKV7_9BACL|nr:response regulator [Paenibacillus agaridevorans]GBG06269.1 DNA-binding response regulator [Paenibacillus agaridevorans]